MIVFDNEHSISWTNAKIWMNFAKIRLIGQAITELIFGHQLVFFSCLVLASDHFSGLGLNFTTLVRYFQPLSRKPQFGQTSILISLQ